MRIVFMGTPEFAVPSLDILYNSHHEVAAVVTVPDKPAGRGRKLQRSAIHEYALEKNIAILQPEKLKDPEFLKKLESLKAGLFVVVAFRMLPEVVWRMPERGTINLHASLLPQFRGAAPINWAIIEGESKTGATTFFINENIDTGDILLQTEVEIKPDTYLDELYESLRFKGAELLLETINGIESGNLKARPQQRKSEIKMAPKLNRDNTRLDFNQNVETVYNIIRGLSPYPAAYCYFISGGEKLQIKIFKAQMEKEKLKADPGEWQTDEKHFLKIACKNGWIIVDEAQLEGKRRMKIRDILNGYSFEKAGKFV